MHKLEELKMAITLQIIATLATVPQSLSECRIDLHDAHGHTPLKAETVMHIAL